MAPQLTIPAKTAGWKKGSPVVDEEALVLGAAVDDVQRARGPPQIAAAAAAAAAAAVLVLLPPGAGAAGRDQRAEVQGGVVTCRVPSPLVLRATPRELPIAIATLTKIS
eukprot:SAG25_NODE_309_length_10042_cov_25.194609_15_plen_109_part_00